MIENALSLDQPKISFSFQFFSLQIKMGGKINYWYDFKENLVFLQKVNRTEF